MSQIGTFSDKAGSKITIKQYDPLYSTKLSQLAETVDEVNSLNGFIYGKRIFNGPYHTKSQKYKDSVIIFAEDLNKLKNDEPMVCASIELDIKEAFIDGQPTKIGYISDLRVHPEYRRKGLASKLIEELEKQGKEKGVNMFYSLLLQGNDKEKISNLFEKGGYIPSNQANVFNFEFSKYTKSEPTTKIGTEEVQFREVTKARAKELLRQYYEQKDFFLTNPEEYFDSPDYQGTYVVETANGELAAGVSLFDTPKESRLILEKLFIPTDYAFNKWAHIPTMSAISLLAAAMFYVLNGRFQVNPKTAASVSIGLNLGFLFVYTKLLNASRVLSGKEPKCRYSGLFYHGRPAEKDNLFKFLFSNVENRAYEKGYHRGSLQVDSTDVLGQYLPKGDNICNYSLYYKGLNRPKETESKFSFFKNFSFYDPRDW